MGLILLLRHKLEPLLMNKLMIFWPEGRARLKQWIKLLRRRLIISSNREISLTSPWIPSIFSNLCNKIKRGKEKMLRLWIRYWQKNCKMIIELLVETKPNRITFLTRKPKDNQNRARNWCYHNTISTTTATSCSRSSRKKMITWTVVRKVNLYLSSNWFWSNSCWIVECVGGANTISMLLLAGVKNLEESNYNRYPNMWVKISRWSRGMLISFGRG